MLIRWAYTLLLSLTAPFLLFGLYKSKPNKPKFGKRWKEHFGITPKLASASRPIWIHAASVGETLAATPLIKAMKQSNPEQVIVVTTTTSTGAEQVEKLGDLVEHRYMPIDFSFAVRGFIKATQPAKMLIIETELWPNTLNTVSKADIPITVVNARLSEKSRANYAKVQPLFNQIHPALTTVLCQTQSDADRFISLGTEPSKVTITGSIKFDISIPDETIKKSHELRQLFGQNRPVWIAASTHKGEDEQLLKAHHTVLKSNPDALLIIVPRHPERFDDVFNLCQNEGFKATRRTAQESITTEHQVYLGDTMGEMLVLIGAADVCFMAGSLIGKKVGGHNILEPAALGVPVITGPSYYNFTEIVESLESQDGVLILQPEQISSSVNQLFSQPELRKSLTENANVVVNSNQGSLARTIASI
jgi:3-deoxy-D-manno-octulosonic-acid transferase